jgi:hypothetical protein
MLFCIETIIEFALFVQHITRYLLVYEVIQTASKFILNVGQHNLSVACSYYIHSQPSIV